MIKYSKSTQKLLALLFMTAVLCLGNSPFVSSLPGFARDSGKVKQAGGSKAKVGKAAPQFALKDLDGKVWKLSKLKGKVVVLEWFNHGCPFVKKHYDSGNMQKLQKQFTDKGVVWLSVCSSAEGRQGFQSAEKHKEMFKEKGGAPSAVLVDADGKVGKLYDAKTTPHMFIINKEGILAYAGAIDDTPGVDKNEVKDAKNFVAKALDELLAGKAVSVSSSKAYGCSVKYAN